MAPERALQPPRGRVSRAYAQPHVDAGRLVRVLKDWCPPFPGYHLYYPSRRPQSPAFAILLDALGLRTSSAESLPR